jgi:murein tripeptide amidase MpaA
MIIFLKKIQDTQVQEISINFDWYIVPITNPDGYKHCLEKDRLWRKNRRPFGRTRGIDINANFDIDFAGGGSSTNPNSRDFRGPYPLSEPETKALARFVQGRRNLRTLICRNFSNFHLSNYN